MENALMATGARITGLVTRWWWVRHAPVPNPEARCYGQSDKDCDVSNQALFEHKAKQLPKAGAEMDKLNIDADLAEQHFGDWQGLTYVEIAEKHADNHLFWLAPPEQRPPGGESFVDLRDRTVKSIDRLTEEHRGRDIVATAHGGTIRPTPGAWRSSITCRASLSWPRQLHSHEKQSRACGRTGSVLERSGWAGLARHLSQAHRAFDRRSRPGRVGGRQRPARGTRHRYRLRHGRHDGGSGARRRPDRPRAGRRHFRALDRSGAVAPGRQCDLRRRRRRHLSLQGGGLRSRLLALRCHVLRRP